MKTRDRQRVPDKRTVTCWLSAVLATCCITLMPAAAFGSAPQKVVVEGKRDPSTVVVKGVRDPSAWFRIESQHMILYSDDDPEDVIELVNNLERLDYLLRLYLQPFMEAEETLPKPTLYFQGSRRRNVAIPPKFSEHPADRRADAAQGQH